MNYFKIGHLYEEEATNTILLITQERDELNNTSVEAIIVCSNLPLYSFRCHNGNRIFIDDDVERYYFKNIVPEKMLSF
jgi:hypothetical protein